MNPLSRSDACRLAQRRDALGFRRALFEPFDMTQGRLRELVRSVVLASVPSNSAGRGVNGFWPFLPKQKGLACRGETRRIRTSQASQVLSRLHVLVKALREERQIFDVGIIL